MKSKLDNFLDRERKIRSWPAKRANQKLVLEHLSTQFSEGIHYTEPEVNEIIKLHHTFNDHCFLRRSLVDFRLLERTPDGRFYWKVSGPVEQQAEAVY